MTYKSQYIYLTDSNKGVSYKWDYNNMLARVNYGYGGFGMSDYMQFARTASGRMMGRKYAKVKTPSLFPRAAALNPRPGTTIGGTFDKPIDSIGGTIGKPIDINRFYEFTLHDRYGHYEFTDGRLTRINTSTGYRDSNGTHIYVRDWQGNVRAVVSRDGGSTVFDQTTYYYPYGLPMAESTSPQTNPYKYTAKELLTDQALNLADHGARMYDPATARWLSRDPLSSTYPSDSHYLFCAGDPINFIDIDGCRPIYSNTGEFLGTDDSGLQGAPIFMDSKNFSQGMAENDALKVATNYSDITAQAWDNMQSHFDNLPNRPDFDGYITLNEANKWYRSDSGLPLFADLQKIDLSQVSLDESINIGSPFYINLLSLSNPTNDGLVYGNITLIRNSHNTVRAKPDTYDFDMHSWRGSIRRNILTIIGNIVAGPGTPYKIYFYGTQQVKVKD